MQAVGEAVLAVLGFVAVMIGAGLGINGARVYAASRGIPRGDSRYAVILFGGFILWPVIAAVTLIALAVRLVRR